MKNSQQKILKGRSVKFVSNEIVNEILNYTPSQKKRIKTELNKLGKWANSLVPTKRSSK